ALPQEAKEKAKLSNPPKAKFKTGERVVVKALKGTKSNEAVITLVGAAVPDENGKWSVGYQVQLVHNGQIVEYKESDLAGFKDCLLS
ncbi:MAG: hypothetical protein FWE79_00995, partial [Firmicutes bacterium]|nr:hypothetical protein [Bacillota bacterium]